MNEMNPKIKRLLDEMKDVPPRDPHAAARGRARFLAQAGSIQQTVSGRNFLRLTEWKINRKEKFAMNLIVSAIVILSMVFGGGATVYAAQDDLPTEALYPIKTLTEDIRLCLNSDPQAEIDLLMQLAQTRIEEMVALTAMNVTPPAEVAIRLEQHIQMAMQTASGMNEDSMQGALQKIHTALQTQAQVMTILQTQASDDALQALAQTRAMLEERIRLVASGLSDPQGFRETIRQEHEYRYDQTETPAPRGTPHGPQPSKTPAPGSSGQNGSGNGGSQPSSTPPSGYGNGEPQPSQTPSPGQEHGSTSTPGGHGSGGQKP